MNVTRVLISFCVMAAALSSPWMPYDAEAKSRTCVRLERQLASLSRSTRSRQSISPRKRRGIKSSIKRQRMIIRRTQQRLDRGRCRGGFFQRSNGSGVSCRSLKSSLGKMKSNLRKLRSQLNGSSSRSKHPTRRESRRIKRALAANHCNELRPLVASNRSGVLIERRADRRTVIEQIFGEERRYRERSRRQNPGYYDDDQMPRSPISRWGTYRTMCVRTCDGYYFPISFSTTPSNFGRDIDACSAKCPGTETDLYYHATQGEKAEDMISFSTEQPYTALKNAFSFRKSVTPGCGCRFAVSAFDPIAGDEKPNGEKPKEDYSSLAVPVFRVDRAEDPETLANLKGSFVPKSVGNKLADEKKTTPAGERKIRVVGEAFFPTR